MLEVEALSAGYGRAQALWDVSLTVGDREIVTIIGPNGAGKSTLVNVLAGMHPSWGGRIIFDGVDLTTLKPHEVCAAGIAVVPEGRQVFPDMTVSDNLQIGAYHTAARSARKETYDRVCDIFPILGERTQQLAGSLSGGEQQMLAIGRALMAQPRLLLLDEPSLGLDATARRRQADLRRQQTRDGDHPAMLWSTHMVEELEGADRIVLLVAGQVVRIGTPAELIAESGAANLTDAYIALAGVKRRVTEELG